MAFIIAIHEIEDADAFRRATDPSTSFPDGMRLHRIYPLVDGARAVCLWEGESADSIGDVVDTIVGVDNRTECYEVDTLSAVGLPETYRGLWAPAQD